MALKLAELDWMRDHIGEYPVLLLDEVVAELDSKRREYLLSRLQDGVQTLVTTTELEIFSADFINRADILEVEAGQISNRQQRDNIDV